MSDSNSLALLGIFAGLSNSHMCQWVSTGICYLVFPPSHLFPSPLLFLYQETLNGTESVYPLKPETPASFTSAAFLPIPQIHFVNKLPLIWLCKSFLHLFQLGLSWTSSSLELTHTVPAASACISILLDLLHLSSAQVHASTCFKLFAGLELYPVPQPRLPIQHVVTLCKSNSPPAR